MNNPLTNRYPWLVAIKRTVEDGNPPRFFTGTLVSDQYVVTTANVVDKKAVAGYNKNHFRATTFKQPIKKMKDIKEWQEVAEIIPHPFYKSDSKPSTELSYNVGLLKLAKSVEWSAGVGPICLPVPNRLKLEELPGQSFYIYTFQDLVKVELLGIETNKKCLESWPRKARHVNNTKHL